MKSFYQYLKIFKQLNKYEKVLLCFILKEFIFYFITKLSHNSEKVFRYLKTVVL